MNKEEVYDTQISPLMKQIIAICQQNKIAMLASYFIPTDDDPTLACSTALLTDDYSPPHAMREAYNTIRRRQSPILITMHPAAQ